MTTQSGLGSFLNKIVTDYNDSGVGKKLINIKLFGTDEDGNVSEILIDANGVLAITKDKYITYIDEAGSGITYIGKAVPGSATSASVWQIKRVDESSNPCNILYEDGDLDFDNDWDSRAAGAYS